MGFVQGALATASKVGPNIFPLGRIVKVVRSRYKVTNSTNPLKVWQLKTINKELLKL